MRTQDVTPEAEVVWLPGAEESWDRSGTESLVDRGLRLVLVRAVCPVYVRMGSAPLWSLCRLFTGLCSELLWCHLSMCLVLL